MVLASVFIACGAIIMTTILCAIFYYGYFAPEIESYKTVIRELMDKIRELEIEIGKLKGEL
jgi:hypothetical protein